jgi:hypothetical protein
MSNKTDKSVSPLYFWLEVKNKPNINYLSSKTNSINQSVRSTNALLIETITYHPATFDKETGEDGSMKVSLII